MAFWSVATQELTATQSDAVHPGGVHRGGGGPVVAAVGGHPAAADRQAGADGRAGHGGGGEAERLRPQCPAENWTASPAVSTAMQNPALGQDTETRS